MIDGLKPYPAMKETGVPWLGDVPEHWDVLPNRTLFSEVKDPGHGDEPLLSVTIGRGIIQQAELLSETTKKDASNLDKSKYKLVQPGDLAYNKMRAWQGAVGASRYRGIVSPAYIVQRPRAGLSPEFIHHLFRTPAFAKEAERWSYGITSDQWSLRPEHFKMIYSLRPSPEEQRLIIHFVRHVAGGIRRAIRAKQKLIKLLEDQKQVIVHSAVTRGLDSSVPLMPSGNPWLADIPRHWKLQRLKRVCRVQGGYAFPSSAFGDLGIPVIRMNNLRRGTLTLSGAARIPEAECVPAFALKPGDILYGLSGSIGATGSLGNYAVVVERDLPAMLNQRVARFVLRLDSVDPKFLIQLIQTTVFYEQVLSDTTGTAQFNVSTKDIENVAIALPSLDEQAAIVTYVEEKVAPLVTTISSFEREALLLREYRTRLIADVVTGKLDVREAAGRMPHEVEGIETLEGEGADEGTDDGAAMDEEEAA